ncbi:MAG: hypothetical protein JJU28_10370 [Cyclobacteriaceae bacterium]|nr:hypothetical protein [Cyclobacteriaceae bacterium]
MKYTKQAYLTGKKEAEPEYVRLKAGPLQMLYQKGLIRYVCNGDAEIIRMIYSAVRDANWNTVEPQIIEEKLDKGDDFFNLELTCRYKFGEIDFRATYIYNGRPDGTLQLLMEGEAHSDFRKNRIGFCVLHPIENCAGKSCQILHTHRENSTMVFPEKISPHQPCFDIAGMRWQPSDKIVAELHFEGEVFEMEDQRNWTDASYKTYCTPLDNPFPVLVRKGEKIRQKIILSAEGLQRNMVQNQEPELLTIDPSTSMPLPELGICLSQIPEEKELEKFSEIPFRHFRIDLRFDETWEQKLAFQLRCLQKLNSHAAIAIHFDQKQALDQCEILISQLKAYSPKIKYLIILEKSSKATPNELLELLITPLRKYFRHAQIGAGTDAFFAELNRNRIDPKDLDFISWSINPQVHHFDDMSLVETLEAQSYTVETAKSFANAAKIHISPLSLKMRFNPNATTESGSDPDDGLPASVDPRQSSLFNAGWTLGSIKYLAMAGVASATYFEATGYKGIMMGDTPPKEGFYAGRHDLFPVFLLFKYLLNLKNPEVLLTQSSKPLDFEALAIRHADGISCFITNFTSKTQRIILRDAHSGARLYRLNIDTVADFMHGHMEPAPEIVQWRKESRLELLPYELMRLDLPDNDELRL